MKLGEEKLFLSSVSVGSKFRLLSWTFDRGYVGTTDATTWSHRSMYGDDESDDAFGAWIRTCDCRGHYWPSWWWGTHRRTYRNCMYAIPMLSLCTRSSESSLCRFHITPQTLHIRNWDENGHLRFWSIMRGVRLHTQETSAVWWFAILCWSASTAYVPFLVARLLLRSIIAVWWQFNAARCPERPYNSICSKKRAFPASKSTDESWIVFAHCQSKILHSQEVFVPKPSLLLSVWLWVRSNSSQTNVCEHQIQYDSSYYVLSSTSC